MGQECSVSSESCGIVVGTDVSSSVGKAHLGGTTVSRAHHLEGNSIPQISSAPLSKESPMAKIKKFPTLNIRKITGGKDPKRLVEEFLLRRSFDPDKCEREGGPDGSRWMIPLGEGQELEILVEGLKKPAETTIYMGVNIAIVPIRRAHDMLVSALEIADGLVGVKVSLVGHYLVLSASMSAAGIAVDDLEYSFKLIEAQQGWFCNALTMELGWDEFQEE
jgi:hypothetical protein